MWQEPGTRHSGELVGACTASTQRRQGAETLRGPRPTNRVLFASLRLCVFALRSFSKTVRLYVGNIGPNGISSFHIIGEIFDKVYVEGAIGGTVNKNVQTTLIPAAGTAIVEFKVDVPGAYLLVDHSIFRVAKGAVGVLTVSGKDNHAIFNEMNP